MNFQRVSVHAGFGCNGRKILERAQKLRPAIRITAVIDRVHADDRGRLQAQLAAHLEGKTPLLESEYRIRHRGGTYLWVLTRGAAVRDRSGAPYRIAGSQTDVTDRRGYDPLTAAPAPITPQQRKEAGVDFVAPPARAPETAKA